MISRTIRTVIACASMSGMLAGCATSGVPASGRITLPEPPADLRACFARAFPEIPLRALTRADVVRIIGNARVLDVAKSACGDRAVAWIEGVAAAYGRPPDAARTLSLERTPAPLP